MNSLPSNSSSNCTTSTTLKMHIRPPTPIPSSDCYPCELIEALDSEGVRHAVAIRYSNGVEIPLTSEETMTIDEYLQSLTLDQFEELCRSLMLEFSSDDNIHGSKIGETRKHGSNSTGEKESKILQLNSGPLDLIIE